MEKRKTRNIIILGSLVLILGFFVRSVMQKQEILKNADLVLLELAPVDPRSLIQGDYMILDYQIAQEIRQNWYEQSDSLQHNIPKRGYIYIELDSLGVAKYMGLSNTLNIDLAPKQHVIKYYNFDSGSLNIGAESFLFEEGKDKDFQQAKFGALKVDKQGNSVLIGLYDQELKPIL